MNASTCRTAACRKRILWRQNVETARKVPLDAEPTPSDDRFVTSRRFHFVILNGETCRPATVADWNDHTTPVHISHFRTCLDPNRWSRQGEDR